MGGRSNGCMPRVSIWEDTYLSEVLCHGRGPTLWFNAMNNAHGPDFSFRNTFPDSRLTIPFQCPHGFKGCLYGTHVVDSTEITIEHGEHVNSIAIRAPMNRLDVEGKGFKEEVYVWVD